ncbi:DUF4145 domain-containing protein [Clostridium sp. LY3-2]|uniref:DUF4145 domain-containing protein n=1 Tax=Clostridium sp. LY3-2 TaxID=2942482 RepID=UPI002152545D|nr:DUF4145 domain-containing protein [Clostridium sp. LY3-2]MCR6515314.1 DUF4145 domain-containing protein [Clostridium sp. LY3-2]
MTEIIEFEDTKYENYSEYCRARGLDKIEECPICNVGISPDIKAIFNHNEDEYLISICPSCEEVFIIKYGFGSGGNFRFIDIFPKNEKDTIFDDKIEEVSQQFIKIYEQASKAEKNGLDEIAGMGYRKALEFLIKDYVSKINSDQEEEIKKMLLSRCINDLIENPKIKSMAQRAAWLGNDETHYIRKWEDKDITDLKNIIDLTVYWILFEMHTKEYEEIMSR